MKKSVTLVEMGLRDGLQNEKTVLSVDDRVRLGLALLDAGIQRLEAGANVSEKWVPQMASTSQVVNKLFSQIKSPKISSNISVLVPNVQGLEKAIRDNVQEIAIFASATESFSQKNINCSIEESFEQYAEVIKLAKKHKIKVRGYLSVCFGCPYEGAVSEKKVIELAVRLHKMGCYEISIGDTIGIGHVGQVESLFKKLKTKIPTKKIAAHFHDTRGQALANILAAHKLGITTFDSSIGGLGGCPYAPGALGNVSTEDVVYMFHGMGIKTGYDLKKLCAIAPWLTGVIKHPLSSRVAKVGI